MKRSFAPCFRPIAIACCVCFAIGCRTQLPAPEQADRPQKRPYAEPERETERPSRSERRSERRGERRNDGLSAGGDVSGGFDFYVLNLSWSPEFCVTHPQAAECAAHPGFVLHGLWPQNRDGSYPQHCSDAPGPVNEGEYRDILPDRHLLEHEWETHGTCSELSPDAYFSEARQAKVSISIPQELQGVSTELQRTPEQILNEFAQANPSLSPGSFALSCGNNRLTAIEVCLTKDLKGTSCSGVRSCRANAVKVTPPGAQ